MTRVLIERHVEVAAPAGLLWDYVTDWPAQREWVPMTRVELVDPGDPARRLGGRIRAWTGLGPVGFWDHMTLTSWEVGAGGGGRCEVLHTGSVVRGEGEFAVEATGSAASRFLWKEMVVLPLGRLGALGWRVARPVVESQIDGGLQALREQVERRATHRAG